MAIQGLMYVTASLVSLMGAAALGAETPIPKAPKAKAISAPVTRGPKAASLARPWTDKASLSLVATNGNSKGNSLGFSNEFLYKWTHSALAVNFGGVRIETTNFTRSASGLSTQPGGYVLTETETKALTSDAYFANGRYDYKFTEHFFAFGGASWERNRPAGLDSRQRAIAGIGVQWLDTTVTKLRTDIGGGYTKEEPVFKPAGFKDSYGTYQVSARLEQKLWGTSALTSEAAYLANADDKDDYLTTWRTAITAKMSDHLALKIGYDLVYKNKPNSVGVTVMSVINPNIIVGQVPVALKKTDTMLTTSLVINF